MLNNSILRDECFDSIRWLEDLDQGALLEAGGKGANLGELVKAALPVPPGFVVTAAATAPTWRRPGCPTVSRSGFRICRRSTWTESRPPAVTSQPGSWMPLYWSRMSRST